MHEQSRLLRSGDRGWLVELDQEAVLPLAAAVRARAWSALVTEVVPAARTVLVVAATAAHTRTVGVGLRELLAQQDPTDTPAADGRTIEIPVHYDGTDLAAVAEAVAMSPKEVTEAHTTATHVVGFFGFAPGFAYINGLPEELALPRRATPRTKITAGQVAIAGNQTVVYPGTTPGGWHLIGHTNERLWDPQAVPPNRLSIGDQVVFRAVQPC